MVTVHLTFVIRLVFFLESLKQLALLTDNYCLMSKEFLLVAMLGLCNNLILQINLNWLLDNTEDISEKVVCIY